MSSVKYVREQYFFYITYILRLCIERKINLVRRRLSINIQLVLIVGTSITNRDRPIHLEPILTDFEDFNLTDTDF